MSGDKAAWAPDWSSPGWSPGECGDWSTEGNEFGNGWEERPRAVGFKTKICGYYVEGANSKWTAKWNCFFLEVDLKTCVGLCTAFQ